MRRDDLDVVPGEGRDGLLRCGRRELEHPLNPPGAFRGSTGEIVFGDRDAGGNVVQFTVVEVRPPRAFSFRWTHPVGDAAVESNYLSHVTGWDFFLPRRAKYLQTLEVRR